MTTVLAVDVSNSLVSFALWRDARAVHHWQLSSDRRRTADEYRVQLTQLLAKEGLPCGPDTADGIVLASVAPSTGSTVTATCRALFATEPLIVGPGVRSGLPIATENPREVGPDRIANAVAARAQFGAPVIVLDFGTALTLDVVGPEGHYRGAAIAPGIGIAAEGLARRAAQLGRIELSPPPQAIATDTENGLRSGLVLGYLGLIDGLVRRVRDEIGHAPVVATGEAALAPAVVEQSAAIEAYEPLLTLDGLRRIYARHAERR